MKTKLFIALTTFILLFTQCIKEEESDYEKQVDRDNQKIQNYLNTNNIDAKDSERGYFYEEINTNPNGQAVTIDSVIAFYYSMQLLDGTVIDSFMDQSQEPLLFQFGNNGLWPSGLEYGIGVMKTGEHYRFYLPSYLAYYEYRHKDYFDAYSNFIIDIKIADMLTRAEILEMEKDSIQAFIARDSIDNAQVQESGLIYVETTAGSGDTVQPGDFLTFHYTRKYLDGTVLLTTTNDDPISVRLGYDEAVDGLEEGLRLMKEGGEALLIMPSNLAFGKSIQVLPYDLRKEFFEEQYLLYDVEPFTPIMYEVELMEIN